MRYYFVWRQFMYSSYHLSEKPHWIFPLPNTKTKAHPSTVDWVWVWPRTICINLCADKCQTIVHAWECAILYSKGWKTHTHRHTHEEKLSQRYHLWTLEWDDDAAAAVVIDNVCGYERANIILMPINIRRVVQVDFSGCVQRVYVNKMI